MEFFTTDLDGVTIIEPDGSARRKLLESVASCQDEYPEVFLSNSSGVVLSYRNGGILVREENGEVVGSMDNVTVDKAVAAWDLLVSGDMRSLDSLPWKEV